MFEQELLGAGLKANVTRALIAEGFDTPELVLELSGQVLDQIEDSQGVRINVAMRQLISNFQLKLRNRSTASAVVVPQEPNLVRTDPSAARRVSPASVDQCVPSALVAPPDHHPSESFHHNILHQHDAIPLVLPSRIVLTRTDASAAYLDVVLRSSDYTVTHDQSDQSAVTYTHPTHGACTGFVVTSAGRELMRRLSDRRLGVLAAVGPARKGKSTFLSQVLQWGGHVDARFRSSSSSDSCTMGIWAWPSLLSLPNGREEDPEKLQWLVLDVEGFFAVDKRNGRADDADYFARLFGVASLLASFVIYFDHIEHAVTSHDLSVFVNIGDKMQEFRRRSATLRDVMGDNQRPVAFAVRNWQSTSFEEWTLDNDTSYWNSLGGIEDAKELIDLFASQFRFVTLPVFNEFAKPRDLSLAKASDEYQKKFRQILQSILTKANATSNFRVHGIEFGGCGEALEAQLDTITAAFSTEGIHVSSELLRERRARWNVMRETRRVLIELDTHFAEALRNVMKVDVQAFQATLDSIVSAATFREDDLCVAAQRNPKDDLSRHASTLVTRLVDAVDAEIQGMVPASEFEDSIPNMTEPRDLIPLALRRIPAALQDRGRPLLERRLDAAMEVCEAAAWLNIQKAISGTDVSGLHAIALEKCQPQERLDMIRRFSDPGWPPRVVLVSLKPWLRSRLQPRWDQCYADILNSISGFAQEVALAAVKHCYQRADVPDSIDLPEITAVVCTEASTLRPLVTMAFADRLLPIDDLHVAAVKSAECSAIADDLWKSVWRETVRVFTAEIEKLRAQWLLYARVFNVPTRQEARAYAAPFEAVGLFFVATLTSSNEHVVALTFAGQAEYDRALGMAHTVANVRVYDIPLTLIGEVEWRSGERDIPQFREQICRVSQDAVVLHVCHLSSSTVAVSYLRSSSDKIPRFDANWVAGARMKFFEPVRLTGAALPPDAVLVRKLSDATLVYSVNHREQPSTPPKDPITDYPDDWYVNAKQLFPNHRPSSLFHHKRFCADKWLQEYRSLSGACDTKKQWCDDGLCALRNLVMNGTASAITTGQYIITKRNTNDKDVVLLPKVTPAFEMIACSQLDQLVPPRSPPARVRVVRGDTLEVAAAVGAEPNKLLILNMANATTCGGGYTKGRAAQEEDLFRRTSYSQVASEAQRQYPMGPFDVHLAKNVAVFRGPQSSGYDFFDGDLRKIFLADFIGAAAFDLGGKAQGQTLPETPDNVTLALKDQEGAVSPAWTTWTARKIQLMLHTAASRGYTSLVLGAWGTGAFHNPVDRIVELFRLELTKYAAFFTEVVFAITDVDKATQFEQAFAPPLPAGHLHALSVQDRWCPFGGLCQRLDDEIHCSAWRHPSRCPSCSGDGAVHGAVHQTCVGHKIRCRHWATCSQIHRGQHSEHYTHAPRCFVEECDNVSPEHVSSFLHLPLCDKGLECPQRQDHDHCAKFRHRQPKCESGLRCRQFFDRVHMSALSHPFQNPCDDFYTCKDRSADHLSAFSHPCDWGESCNQLDDQAHVRQSIHFMDHACPLGAKCQQVLDEEHLDTFSHPDIRMFRSPCRHGADCRERQVREHVKKFSHRERDLAPCIGYAPRSSQFVQGASATVHHADRRVNFSQNAADMIAAVRRHWREVPDPKNEDFVQAVKWVDGLLPIHRCDPQKLVSMMRLGAAVSADELRMVMAPETSSIALQRFVKINPTLSALMHKFPAQSAIIQNYAVATVAFAVQSKARETPLATSTAGATGRRLLDGGIGRLESEQLEAQRGLIAQLPADEADKVKSAVNNLRKACLDLCDLRKPPGIGFGVDAKVGTDNTVFSIIGPHTQTGYGHVQLIFRREVMNMPTFYMLPCAATHFHSQKYAGSNDRPWAAKGDASWEREGREALAHSKLHPVEPQWSTALALDLAARKKTMTMRAVRDYYLTTESHQLVEGHLPQSLSLDYVLNVVLLHPEFNSLPTTEQSQLRETFGDRLLLCNDEREARDLAWLRFGNARFVDRPRRGFAFSLLADPSNHVNVPCERAQHSPFLLAFRYRGSSMVIALSNRGASTADQTEPLKQYCVYFNHGSVSIASTPADAMSATPAVHVRNFFHEDPKTTFMHVYISLDNRALTVQKWGPTEVRNPNHKRALLSLGQPTHAIRYVSVLAIANIEVLDFEALPNPPPSVIATVSTSTKTPNLITRFTNLFRTPDAPPAGAVGPTPAAAQVRACTAPLGSCEAYCGSPQAKQQHVVDCGRHRCLWGPRCREMTNPAHEALFHHDVTLPECANGAQCGETTNSLHRQAFSHTNLWDFMLVCRFGACCRDSTSEHRLKFRHDAGADAAAA